jgi:bifunctional UDP-N-acetylglucosamine pyrophosphorylase/glucosamine-1-phosphate N-acetyltransferase
MRKRKSQTATGRSRALRGDRGRQGAGRAEQPAAKSTATKGSRAAASAQRVPLSIIILAAGEGKRMRSALPKVLQPLAGRPLLQHVVDTARRLDPEAIHVVYGHGGERVREALAHEALSWTLQPERLGTGHAVRQAMPQIPDDHQVLVLYGDVPLISHATLIQLLQLAGPHGLCLLTVELDDPEGYGRIVRNARGLVRKIVEQKDASRAQLAIHECNTGVLVSPAAQLRDWLARLTSDNSQGEYYLTDVIATAVAEKIAVHALLAREPGEVLGVNDKSQLAELESVCRGRAARALMLAGVTLADPARIDVRGTVAVGSDVFIDVNAVLEGTVVLGDRVRIGPNCVIRDSEIGADTQVFAHCVIDGARIGPDCNIGPFARFRPSAALATGVHIGNFVEVKNSRLGARSKANHLAYVGDAEVGTRVNIGAGTIVANYDGANKHATVIGDDVHTGSNSVLVAPITVGAGATIAAGSTVTHSVAAGKLTLARARQVTVEGWRRPVKSDKSDK